MWHILNWVGENVEKDEIFDSREKKRVNSLDYGRVTTMLEQENAVKVFRSHQAPIDIMRLKLMIILKTDLKFYFPFFFSLSRARFE